MPNLQLYTENGEDKIRSLGGDSHCLSFHNSIRPFLSNISLLESYFKENISLTQIDTLDLSINRLDEINIRELQQLLQIMAEMKDIRFVKLNDMNTSRRSKVLEILPAWIKTVVFGKKYIHLDTYWIEDHYRMTKTKGQCADIVASRLIYQLQQLAQEADNDMFNPRFLDLPIVESLKKKFKTELEAIQKAMVDYHRCNPGSKREPEQLFSKFTDALWYALRDKKDQWSLFALALLGELKLSVYKADENYSQKKWKDTTDAVLNYNQSVNAFISNKPSSIVNFCRQRINVISNTNENDLAQALINLKEITSRTIKCYIKLSRKQTFSLFGRHGLIGRMRAERLNKTLSGAQSTNELANNLVTFLADPSNGNYYKNSLRIMLVNHLLNDLYVPGFHERFKPFETDENSFNNHLKILAKCLSIQDEKIRVPENESSSCCSFGG